MKSKERVGVFTQRSGQPPDWEGGNLSICSACRWLEFHKSYWTGPSNLAGGAGNILFATRHCVRRMYQFKCSLQNVFFHHTHHPNSLLTVGLFRKKKKNCFSCLANQPRRSNFSCVGVCIMSCFGQIVLSLHPPLWLPGNWGGLNSFKMFKLGKGGGK